MKVLLQQIPEERFHLLWADIQQVLKRAEKSKLRPVIRHEPSWKVLARLDTRWMEVYRVHQYMGQVCLALRELIINQRQVMLKRSRDNINRSRRNLCA